MEGGVATSLRELNYFSLFYDPDLNRFFDSDGIVLNSLHELFTPWQVIWAKQQGVEHGYCVLESKRGEMIELFFPEEWADSLLFWDIYYKTF